MHGESYILKNCFKIYFLKNKLLDTTVQATISWAFGRPIVIVFNASEKAIDPLNPI